MKPHQQRVVEEKAELDAKLAKLKEFFGTDLYVSLDREEQRRLSHQHTVMTMYSDVLGMRIVAFHQPETGGASSLSNPDVVGAIDDDSIFASCNCLTKTPEVRFHKKGCKYRLICERNELYKQVTACQQAIRLGLGALAFHPEPYVEGEKYHQECSTYGIMEAALRPTGCLAPAASSTTPAASSTPNPDPRTAASITRSEPGDGPPTSDTPTSAYTNRSGWSCG